MYLIRIGWPVFRARKTSMLIYALCVSPIIFAQILGSMSMWYAVFVIGFAAAAHQAWSANIFTTVSDMFPKRTVASVTGIGGMAGDLGLGTQGRGEGRRDERILLGRQPRTTRR